MEPSKAWGSIGGAKSPDDPAPGIGIYIFPSSQAFDHSFGQCIGKLIQLCHNKSMVPFPLDVLSELTRLSL